MRYKTVDPTQDHRHPRPYPSGRDDATLKFLIDAAGASHVLLGSDYPFDMGYYDGIRQVRSLSIPKSDQELILGDTAKALLEKASQGKNKEK